MSMLLGHLKRIREFNRYAVFSDGAPTQLKQKFTVWNDIASAVSQLEEFICRTTSHGKGQQMELEVELSVMYIT